MHRPVIIDDATGRPACPPYAGKRVHQELYEFWPSDLSEVFAKAGIPRRKPPQNRDVHQCRRARRLAAPHHLAPARRRLCVAAGPAGRQPIALSAVTDADVRALYWFAGDDFIGSSKPGEPLFWQPASAGNYVLRAVDDRGRSDERPLEVRLID